MLFVLCVLFCTQLKSQAVPPTVQLHKKPYTIIRNIPVKEVIKTEAYGEEYYLIYAGGKPDDNVVDIVYFAPATYDGTKKGKGGQPKETLPPVVTMMRYHLSADGKETMGLVTYEEFYNKEFDVWLDTRIENRVKPDCANPLIDLMTGNTKWVYKGRIKFEETDSPKLLPVKQERIY